MVGNKGRSKMKLQCKRHECGKFGLGTSSRAASVFEASKGRLGRHGMRRHGECRAECAGDRSSDVA